MKDITLHYQLRYTPHGRVSHLVPITSIGGKMHAVCGLWPETVWWGTGNQAEHEKAARMHVCHRCKHFADQMYPGQIEKVTV